MITLVRNLTLTLSVKVKGQTYLRMNIRTSLKPIQSLALILVTTFISLTAHGQEYDVDYTVYFINKKLDKKCALFAEKKNLRVEFYYNGEAARIDYIFPESIDFEKGVYYSSEEGAVIVSCYEKAGKCIERDIIKRDVKMLYDRTNLTSECTDDCGALEEAVKHLIQLYVFDNVERTEPFE